MTPGRRIETAIENATGEKAELLSSETRYGGSINDSGIISLRDGRRYFVKTNPRSASLPGMFRAECVALQLFAEVNIIRVPVPVCHADDFVVLEAIEFGDRARGWEEETGRQLALHQKKTRTDRFGFEMDNYIGSTPQPNSWSVDWLSFWREQRLGWQLQLFSRGTHHDDPLLQVGEKLLSRLDGIIGMVTEPPVLLHGDLWSGNAAADRDGQPLLFDPASYYGHREAEIGMMRMFGGFGPRCESAYAEIWPLEPDSERRIDLYRLYHELNHLNLFGSSYYQGCVDTINSIL